jgi:DNA helicase-2/ATP-dependent DNA helicase PcrA
LQELLAQLNPSQRGAVEAAQGPVMIIAGAGSGKTRVITYRTAYLIQSLNVQPKKILALTFTNKAASEMRERVEHLLGDGSTKGLWIGTFHANFARLLRQHAVSLGYDQNFSIYDADDQQKVIKEIMKEVGMSTEQFNPKMVASKISMAKNKFVLPTEYFKLAADYVEEKVAGVYDKYMQRLQKNNAMDFDDLLIKPIQLFQNNDDILTFYQHRFEYLMIDEYQDTNYAQYLVAKLLAAKHRNICVVGDDAQSIYSWRGADISNILSFQKDYADAKVFRLEENYRSTKNILQLSNSAIKRNKNQLEKTLFTSNPTGDPITLIEASSEREEGDKIARTIQDFKMAKGLRNADFAVFYRTNAQSRALEDAMKFRGIAYQIFGGLSFYKRKEVKDVVAYLRFIANERDEESLKRIINVPPRNIGETSLEKLEAFSKAESISLYAVLQKAASLDVPARLLSSINDFRRLIEHLKDASEKESAYDVMIELYRQIKILETLKNEGTVEANSRYDNLQEFLSLAKEFADRNPEGNSLRAFLQEVSLISDMDNEIEDKNFVSLMTFHAAKGLEFPIVFVTGLEEKLFPIDTEDTANLEEERRLFYVGVTRARQKLFLTYSKSRYRFGQQQYNVRSRFVDEVDKSVIITEGGKSYDEVFREERERSRLVMDADYGSQPRRTAYKKDDARHSVFYDDEPRDITPKKPKPVAATTQSSTAKIVVGTQVSHKLFGMGKVIAIQGTGDETKAKIFFRSSGEKSLVIKYANLQVMD